MEYWFVAGLAAFLMGLSKGGMPMIALLAVPMMSLYMDPAIAAGLLLPIYIVADCYAVFLFRRTFSTLNLKILIPAAMVGILVGYFTVSFVDANAVKLLVAGIGLSYLFNSLRRHFAMGEVTPKLANLPSGIFWGTIAGLASYICHAGGPPFQAYVLPQRLEKMAFLGTTTIFFATVNLMKVPPFIIAEQVTWQSLHQAIWLAPMALLGAWSGAKISRILSEKAFFALIETALALVCLMLIHEVAFP
ncbi:sulfite exporter TauE/SafE family protein [Pseudopelagicola sp. nBUS_19]|uniref:sulfite exporter TauE/SafE family protein n=1 Tax=unclassified Pseudopelagicola TaxID=2649563 RepID=UPI003EBAEA25